MNRPTILTAAALAAAAVAVAAPRADAHTFTPTVACVIPAPSTGPNAVATFSYSANAAGLQSSTESVTLDGAPLIAPTLRQWTTTAGQAPQTFDRPMSVPTDGPHALRVTAAFVGSDGFRYTRTVGPLTLNCPPRPVTPPPVSPPPITPPVAPPPPVTPPPGNPIEPLPPVVPCRDLAKAATKGGSRAVRLKARARMRALGCTITSSRRVGKPTVCRTFARKPARGFVGAGFPRPGQVRVRFDARRGVWTTAKGDRWTITTYTDGRRVVTFTPGEFDECMSIVPPVTG